MGGGGGRGAEGEKPISRFAEPREEEGERKTNGKRAFRATKKGTRPPKKEERIEKGIFGV